MGLQYPTLTDIARHKKGTKSLPQLASLLPKIWLLNRRPIDCSKIQSSKHKPI